MNEQVLYGLAALTAGGGALAAAARAWPPRTDRLSPGPRPAGFETHPRWARCPAEGRDTPHSFDAGGRRHCRVCRYTTTKDSTMDESFGPEYVRPRQEDCSRCGCCTADLCERGQSSVMRCVAFTPAEHRETVLDCPCSAETTKHTAAWRAAQVRATRLARELPIDADAEKLLRHLADGGDASDDGTVFTQLMVRGLARLIDERPAVSELGRTYLAARDEERAPAAVHVVDVDTRSRTARVEVGEWRADEPVTVLLDQLTSDTGLDAATLPDQWLAAEANCRAADADRLVLTGFRMTDGLPEGQTGGDA
ncbi:hypothetical protein [Streptomyces sp. NBC_00120]|uniref:hypothetical protein n=1 Tax=Streptomyces sp. NBC_00120 TaxID=2975660 RepID=UPI002254C1B5|nr:hypothetical protein [Streptomyces sp. NBC_00120]MCX5326361.1 hypothetical protein [Streptomyces sp. NBC_00120]